MILLIQGIILVIGKVLDRHNMKKVKVIKIDNYDYSLLGDDATYIKNIEIYSNKKLKINDIIYVSEKILNENNLFAFTDLFQDNIILKDDIIKVISKDDEYYLQRIYG